GCGQAAAQPLQDAVRPIDQGRRLIPQGAIHDDLFDPTFMSIGNSLGTTTRSPNFVSEWPSSEQRARTLTRHTCRRAHMTSQEAAKIRAHNGAAEPAFGG